MLSPEISRTSSEKVPTGEVSVRTSPALMTLLRLSIDDSLSGVLSVNTSQTSSLGFTRTAARSAGVALSTSRNMPNGVVMVPSALWLILISPTIGNPDGAGVCACSSAAGVVGVPAVLSAGVETAKGLCAAGASLATAGF